MLFTSVTFVFFQILVVLLRWVLPKRAVPTLLLLSSYLFYLTWSLRYVFLIGAVTVVGWALGRVIEETRNKKFLALGVSAFLLTLAYFKYTNFLISSAFSVFSLLTKTIQSPHYSIVLPLAISFFTFEVISYLVDVYRGAKAEASLFRFALYIAYYPHLIAGPIVRSSELLPQLETQSEFDSKQFSEGFTLFLLGFAKKLIFADRMSTWSDLVFANPSGQSTLGTWVGVLCYAGQIYCDFSGYTDIARGSSKMLGLELPENFDLPYLSRNISDFWRRWHMTLSRWLRDYLYIPLGGNRSSTFGQYRNLILTMTLGGLWHGPNITFVAWGLYHGILLALHKVIRQFAKNLPSLHRVGTSAAMTPIFVALTFVCVCFGWVLFRASTVATASSIYSNLFAMHSMPSGGWSTWPAQMQQSVVLIFVLGLGHLLAQWKPRSFWFEQEMPLIRSFSWTVLCVAIYLFAEPHEQFIYFQF